MKPQDIDRLFESSLHTRDMILTMLSQIYRAEMGMDWWRLPPSEREARLAQKMHRHVHSMRAVAYT